MSGHITALLDCAIERYMDCVFFEHMGYLKLSRARVLPYGVSQAALRKSSVVRILLYSWCQQGEQFLYKCKNCILQTTCFWHYWTVPTCWRVPLLCLILVSNSLLDAVHRVEIVDDGCNLSDHMPVVMLLSLQGPVRDNNTNPSKKVDFKRLRWDKAGLSGYYKCSYEHLSHISVLYSSSYMWPYTRAPR